MRKLRSPDLAPPLEARHSRAWLRWLPYALVALLLAPLAYELTILCAANWQGLYGRVPHIDTPVLGYLEGQVSHATRLARRFVQHPFRMLPWKPSTIMLVGGSWAVITGLLLRRRI